MTEGQWSGGDWEAGVPESTERGSNEEQNYRFRVGRCNIFVSAGERLRIKR